MLPPGIDAILIDFYGTICGGDREAVEAACAMVIERCGLTLTPEEFAVTWGERFFSLIGRSNHDAFRTLHECELLSLRETLAALGHEVDPAPFVAELEAYWRDPPLYADALEFLRSVDVPVCCVSNADTEPLLAAIDRHSLHFDAVISSEMARCYKPEGEIFRQALHALDVTSRQVIHIGDSLHSDIGGASSLGIRSVWVQRESRIHDIGTCKPDCTIGTFTEICRSLSD